MCVSTVRALMPSRTPITRFDVPCATSTATATSRAEREAWPDGTGGRVFTAPRRPCRSRSFEPSRASFLTAK